jgi:hypothetical protein
MIDLEAIFGDDAAPVVLPNGAGMARLLTETEAEAELLAPYLSWVQRPDVDGRMGWEAPDLPEWQRWWARSTFEPEGVTIGVPESTYHDYVPEGTGESETLAGAEPTRPFTRDRRGAKMSNRKRRKPANGDNSD